MFGLTREFDAQVLMTTMMGAVNEIVDKMCSEKFTDGPTTATREITEINPGKMDVDIDLPFKFSSKCFISAINFFKDMKFQEKGNACGFVIVHMKESCLVELFRALGFPPVNIKDERQLLDTSGELCNLIAGEFKNQLAKTGYIDLFMSTPQTHVRSLKEGVDYPRNIKSYHELSFYFFNTKAVIVDVGMSDIPHS